MAERSSGKNLAANAAVKQREAHYRTSQLQRQAQEILDWA
eukprot:CAMPEP_0172465476 /NCGR_PEP_ID=MMETSP1065-20121228/53622_1 /TAXON_ID=265537 /ORGANISM="Amphiprora paludosa, Strain CCMP125" /LENGTH=39 /DNA_ID= /DNA_START= /DNA_END= /DNA_ORIENTATION=